MTEVPAPDGLFQLREMINAGACPQCGEFYKKLWFYIPKDKETDRFIGSTIIPVSCEECAAKKGVK